jgi:hypothetical protein
MTLTGHEVGQDRKAPRRLAARVAWSALGALAVAGFLWALSYVGWRHLGDKDIGATSVWHWVPTAALMFVISVVPTRKAFSWSTAGVGVLALAADGTTWMVLHALGRL